MCLYDIYATDSGTLFTFNLYVKMVRKIYLFLICPIFDQNKLLKPHFIRQSTIVMKSHFFKIKIVKGIEKIEILTLCHI